MNALLTAKHIISSIPFERISSDFSMYPGNWIEHVEKMHWEPKLKRFFYLQNTQNCLCRLYPFSPSLKSLAEGNFSPTLIIMSPKLHYKFYHLLL